MEEDILKIITENHPFTYEEVKRVYDYFNSFDKTITVLKLASSFSVDINEAIKYFKT